MHGSALRLRPHEAPALQALEVQVHAIAAPPQQLDQIPAPAAEHEHVTGERTLLQRGLYLRSEAVHATAHVSHACGEPHTRTQRQRAHLDNVSSTRRSASSATSPVIRTCAPANSISMTPLRPSSGLRRLRAGAIAARALITSSACVASLTATGNNAAEACGAAAPSSRRYCRRHLNRMFALRR